MSIGFYSGISFVHFTTASTPVGIEQNYNGNEADETAEVMKFKKSKHEMLSILHTHFLSMSVVFFLLGLLVYGCQLPEAIRSFLLIEPMLSVLVTFGGIYFIWSGLAWMTYVVMVSGILMTVSFTLSVIVVFKDIVYRDQFDNLNISAP